MITSIVVTGTHSIGMNINNKIEIEGNMLSVEKDIPFIRYRFSEYGEAQYEYIAKMMKQFSYSTHLAEIELSENTETIIKYMTDNIPNMVKYVYINVTNDDVERGELEEYQESLIDKLSGLSIDRIMFRDKSTTLDTVTVKKLIKKYSDMVKDKNDSSARPQPDMFGVCSSPLSFGDWACLTAVKARELMSVYSTVADVALPSANHQCMNCCGCIRYMVVSSDLAAPADSKMKSTTKKSDNTGSNGETKTKTPKASKPIIPFGMHNL